MRDDNWDAVAEAIRDRMAELGMTQKELVIRSGVSESTIRQVRNNYGPRKRSRHTLEDISKGLEWPGDHLGRILDGGKSDTDNDDGEKLRAEVVELRAEVSEMRQYLGTLDRRVERLEHRRSSG